MLTTAYAAHPPFFAIQTSLPNKLAANRCQSFGTAVFHSLMHSISKSHQKKLKANIVVRLASSLAMHGKPPLYTSKSQNLRCQAGLLPHGVRLDVTYGPPKPTFTWRALQQRTDTVYKTATKSRQTACAI